MLTVSRTNAQRAFSVAEDPGPHEADDLYRRHGGWLLAFLRRRFGAQEAEDLAQETYLRLARSKPDIRHPRALLARIALNAARDQVRRAAVRPRFLSQDMFPEQGLPAHQAEALLLKETILALSPKLREVFVLSRFGGLTYEEIARRCSLSVKTVEKRMTKALRTCAQVLDPG